MKIRYLLFLFCLSLVACNDYLEESPNSKYNIEIDNIEKVREMITSAYPSASYFAFLEARTDNVTKREGEVYRNRLNEAMYFWEDYNADEPDSPLFYWNDCYKGIAEVNHALENLKKFPKTEEVKALYGEALVLRAYLHFMLVNIWSEPYNPTTADTDLGIPYLTRPEKNALPEYSRGTVAETYKYIKEDFEIGIGLINDKFYKKPKYHFNKDAAYAFGTRLYLYTGDWDKVILLSNHVLGIDTFSKLKNWSVFSYGSIFYDKDAEVLDFYELENPSNLLIVSTESLWNRRYKTEEYGLDIRKSTRLFGGLSNSLETGFYYPNKGKEATTIRYIEKFKDFATFENSENDNRGVYVNNILFTADEVLLNRIEALIMKREFDKAILDIRNYAKAKAAALSNFTTVKIKNAFSGAQTSYTSVFGQVTFFQASMLQLVAELRRREFIHEGLRWFDIRRFYLSVDRNLGDALELDKVLKKSDNRRVLQIPNDAMKYLTPNPR